MYFRGLQFHRCRRIATWSSSWSTAQCSQRLATRWTHQLLSHAGRGRRRLLTDLHTRDRARPEALPRRVDTKRRFPRDLRQSEEERGSGPVLVSAEENEYERKDQQRTAYQPQHRHRTRHETRAVHQVAQDQAVSE